jgi:hypothetical protein
MLKLSELLHYKGLAKTVDFSGGNGFFAHFELLLRDKQPIHCWITRRGLKNDDHDLISMKCPVCGISYINISFSEDSFIGPNHLEGDSEAIHMCNRCLYITMNYESNTIDEKVLRVLEKGSITIPGYKILGKKIPSHSEIYSNYKDCLGVNICQKNK